MSKERVCPQAKGGGSTEYASPRLFIVCLNLALPRVKGKRSSKRGGRDCVPTQRSELGLWVDSQPNQLVVSTVLDTQFPLSQPP